MTDFRALCAELYAEFDICAVDEADPDLLARAKAALAQPELEGPISESELAAMWNQQADAFNQWESLDSGEQLAWAQARAISRYARPAIEPEGPSDKELWALYQDLGRDFSPSEYARTVLARWGHLTSEGE
jgi:hypothetical protein